MHAGPQRRRGGAAAVGGGARGGTAALIGGAAGGVATRGGAAALIGRGMQVGVVGGRDHLEGEVVAGLPDETDHFLVAHPLGVGGVDQHDEVAFSHSGFLRTH